jgi:hypothetical protein
MTTKKLHNSEDWWVSHDLKKTAQLRIDTDMYKRHKQRSHIVQQRIRIVQFGQPRAKTFTSRNTETIRDAKLLYVKAGRRSATPVPPALDILLMVTRDRIRSGRSSNTVAKKTHGLTKHWSSQLEKSKHSKMVLVTVPSTLSQNHQLAK